LPNADSDSLEFNYGCRTIAGIDCQMGDSYKNSHRLFVNAGRRQENMTERPEVEDDLERKKKKIPENGMKVGRICMYCARRMAAM
jgi:hypothetical protein